ncbi:hypothetical protein BGP78_17790 [Pseudoalteromonas sp. MSK9-3]|uniref:hypothetical protein n=1 Tax=Pseudoalteromonas sp. MSK9-3 TaxID=1897633 RepID=UPI000E6CDE57|nr:hypothetical protein [Pseudoalteromonas sp. MSK9-3]RJE73823.1 hypothetical protein BGP78_17790 [Pseudoalteromonas sp. MSK9-3]
MFLIVQRVSRLLFLLSLLSFSAKAEYISVEELRGSPMTYEGTKIMATGYLNALGALYDNKKQSDNFSPNFLMVNLQKDISDFFIINCYGKYVVIEGEFTYQKQRDAIIWKVTKLLTKGGVDCVKDQMIWDRTK